MQCVVLITEHNAMCVVMMAHNALRVKMTTRNAGCVVRMAHNAG